MKAGCWMVKRETIYKTKQVSRLRGSVARLSGSRRPAETTVTQKTNKPKH